MPRLPVRTPTTTFASTRVTPMKTAPRATHSGRFANDSMEATVAAPLWRAGRRLFQQRRRLQELRLGSKRDQEVACFELQLGAWAHVQRPVIASQRKQLGRRGIE